MSAWRPAKSIVELRDQINEAYPNRDRSSDGMLASGAHHVANPNSDHEPWVRDGDMGIVTAVDITHDPKHGFDSYAFANYLRTHADPRIKYVISNRRIWNPSISSAWRDYKGVNPHDEHVHVSVQPKEALYDSTEKWDIGTPMSDQPDVPDPFKAPTTIKRGDQGEGVRRLQGLLGVTVDGQFGPKTEKAVKDFQRKNNLVADGVVGYYTWRTLIGTEIPDTDKDWQLHITASVFGGHIDPGEKSAYDGHVLDDVSNYVALPYKFRGERPTVTVRGVASGITAQATIQDVGPWFPSARGPADPYWVKGARPRAESTNGTNKAGIDLSPALARELKISGLGLVDWHLDESGD